MICEPTLDASGGHEIASLLRFRQTGQGTSYELRLQRISKRGHQAISFKPIFLILRTVFVVWLLLCPLVCFVVRAEQLPVKTYTIADGLARDYINRIRQDSHGFIWFCTNEGISRFDGYGFTNYGVADGLPDRVVNDVLETRDGALLFAT